MQTRPVDSRHSQIQKLAQQLTVLLCFHLCTALSGVLEGKYERYRPSFQVELSGESLSSELQFNSSVLEIADEVAAARVRRIDARVAGRDDVAVSETVVDRDQPVAFCKRRTTVGQRFTRRYTQAPIELIFFFILIRPLE